MGPYFEAVDRLDPFDRIRLLLLAFQADEWTMTAGWRMEQLAKAAPCGHIDLDTHLCALFEERAQLPRADGLMPQENLEVYLHAVKGLAKFTDRLPATTSELSDDELAWRLVGNIILHLHHPGDSDLTVLWDDILRIVPGAAVDVLASIRQGDLTSSVHDEPSTHGRLLDAFPGQIRQLLTWGLQHRDQLTSLFDNRHGTDPAAYAVSALSAVGDHETFPLLRALMSDPALGAAAVETTRRLHERLAQG